ncbi:hypothetical protein K502DRAFT_333548 [Neoconidiobolus thromboides FSU 785]|nr:hypothetical protein K502DRAFT_333548 [Neoconidiobolus thromboides FSU 785]
MAMDQNSFNFRMDNKSDKEKNNDENDKNEQLISYTQNVQFVVPNEKIHALSIVQLSSDNAPKRYRIINLLTLLQFPDLSSKNKDLKLFMTLTKLLNDDKGIEKQEFHPLKMFRINLPRLPIILNQAKQTFLRNPNLFSPITIESIYLQSTRSKLLNYSIYLSGLLLMDSDPFISSLIDNLTAQIQYLLSFNRLKIKLNTVQAIVILLMGINNIGFINKIQYSLASIALKIAHNIGLHLPQPNLHPKVQLERMLTYNSLMFYVNFSPLMNNVLLMNDIQFQPNKSLKRYLNYFNQLPINTISLSKLIEICSIHFNQCLAYFNLYLFELAKLKEKIVDRKQDKSHYELQCKQLIEKLLLKNSKILQKLYQLKANLIGDLDKINIIQVSIDAIAFRCHYFQFFNFSLSLYNPIKQPHHHTSYTPFKPNKDQLNQALEACACVLEYGIKLNINYNFYGSVGMTSACFIFILRYLDQVETNSNMNKRLSKALKKCRDHFLILKKVKFQYKLATLNLQLFDQIINELNLNSNIKNKLLKSSSTTTPSKQLTFKV